MEMEKIETKLRKATAPGTSEGPKFGIHSMIHMPRIPARCYLSSAAEVRFKLPERDELRTQVISVRLSLLIQLTCCHSSCPFQFMICPLMCLVCEAVSQSLVFVARYWQTCSMKLIEIALLQFLLKDHVINTIAPGDSAKRR